MTDKKKGKLHAILGSLSSDVPLDDIAPENRDDPYSTHRSRSADYQNDDSVHADDSRTVSQRASWAKEYNAAHGEAQERSDAIRDKKFKDVAFEQSQRRQRKKQRDE